MRIALSRCIVLGLALPRRDSTDWREFRGPDGAGTTPARSSSPSGGRRRTSPGRRRSRARAGRRRPRRRQALPDHGRAEDDGGARTTRCGRSASTPGPARRLGRGGVPSRTARPPRSRTRRTATPARRRSPTASRCTSTSGTWAPPA